MSEPLIARAAICLSMIVRDQAHIIEKALDAVAPYISSWVIVDTGSHDGTQELIDNHMARLGVPGQLYQRTWRSLGHNRTEALTLAQGRADYIWVIDADDMLVGTPDLTRLDADVYWLRYGSVPDISGDIFWRAQLFRDGSCVRYEGVTREYAAWDNPYVDVRLAGDYHIASGRLAGRAPDPQAFTHDRDLLLAEVERDPDDARSVFYLAQSYFDQGDFVNAREWFARRAEMGGWSQEVYVAMFRVAESMSNLGVQWLEVQDAFLNAWEFRPSRAEPLHAIARHYRDGERYRLAYLFAKRAAEIPFPEEDQFFVNEAVYAWMATDEQSVSASYNGKHAESFLLSRRLLARPDIPDDQRQRIARNRDLSVPTMFYATSSYPDALVESLPRPLADRRDAEVVVSLVAGPDRYSTEQTLNSFLHCCIDVARVGRFLVVDAGLSAEDRAVLAERYGFVEFTDPGPARLAHIRAQIDGRFWLHLGQGWRFFAPENFIARLTAVLRAESEVLQVGVNFADGVKLTGACAAEDVVCRAPDAGRYVLTDALAKGPAMFDTARLDQAGGLTGTDPDSLTELGPRAAAAGLRTASLDEVLCISAAAATGWADARGDS